MSIATSLATIPQPPALGVLGNIRDIDGKAAVQSLMKLATEYGPLFQLDMPGRSVLVASSYALVDELSDEQRFDKKVHAPLQKVRAFTGDGLFTAETQEPNWHKAHNILLPNFSMKAMQGYMPAMLDIADQLVLKWGRLNPDELIDVPDDMTRLTLDTIGLCGFNYRFNSFYREQPHPFIQAMVRALGESMDQTHRLGVQDKLMLRSHRQFQQDIAFMNGLVDTLIAERRASGATGANDLLGYMLDGVDKQSGQKLDDVNIRHQIITFLIAGHETTSGLLSFATYFLLHNSAALRKAYDEVDRVLGTDLNIKPTYQQVQRLTYIGQILKETLRLWPTAPAYAVYPYQDTVIGGQYAIKQGQGITVLIPQLHRDRAIWGDDVEAFRPERFAPELEAKRPANAYKPFGSGQRACIGRQFALQEAVLVLAMILQRFELIDATNYELKIKETLTLKPDNFHIKIRARAHEIQKAEFKVQNEQPLAQVAIAQNPKLSTQNSKLGMPLLVLYGSNMGTAEGIADQIANDATTRGYTATTAPLDEYAGKLPTAGGVVIVSASYNGLPPDNAVNFVNWLRAGNLAADALNNVRYTVFGVGDHNWASTYQAVPMLIDQLLAAHGAQPMAARGAADAADDFDGQFQAWYGPVWGAIDTALGVAGGKETATAKQPLYSVELVGAHMHSPFVAAYGAVPMTVLVNRELQGKNGTLPCERSTRHVEIGLPEGVRYEAGDHLNVLPRNSTALVSRVLRRFGLDGAATMVIHRSAPGKTHLPLDQPVRVADLLATYVELQEVTTRSQIAVLAAHTECPPHKHELLALSGDDATAKAHYREQIFARHVAVLDLLERYMAIDLPFPVFLEMLPALKPRPYSISSSPLADARRASITVGIVSAPHHAGNGGYNGVASNYLAAQPEGSTVYGFVRQPNVPFRPATNDLPMIMVGPGTGLAPFRGFLQERAAHKAAGAPIARSLLFFGCRHPEQDFLYEDELRQYEADGVVTLAAAFSRLPGQPKTHVQDSILARAGEVWALLEQGAVVYICGDGANMAPAVRAAFAQIYREETGASAEAAESWLDSLAASNRYLTDVWASN